MEYAGTSKQSLNDLLCVEAENADVKGTFFRNPESYEGNIAIFDEVNGKKEYNYGDVIPGDSGERGTSSVFYRGDAIRVATSSSTRSAFGGFLPIPTSGVDGGSCIETNYAHWMEPMRNNICYRYIDDLEASCNNELDTSRFSSLSVCSSYATSFASCSGNWIDIEVGEVTYHHMDTEGTDYIMDVTSNEDIMTQYSNNMCLYALYESCFYIYYTPEGSITKAVVDFTVTNLTTQLPTAQPTPLPTAQPTNVSSLSTPTPTPLISSIFQQSHSLEYIRNGPSTSSSSESERDKGNIVLRGRSGNPGYITGLPLLAGSKVSSSTSTATSTASDAIQALIPGLKVYDASSSSSSCSDINLFNDEASSSSSLWSNVNFGEDMITGCILPISYENFTDMCSQSGPFMTSLPTMNVKVPLSLWMNTSHNYIGIFGNADPLDSSQW
eukprot:CAMPEP_0114341842 /NCGR_PEP_ID=MMETSP0101-20121206/9338_1 /TAXON_ID=38822 ORGANISM="Pteridomonas danica, Strain PT" /NCGR_SAMPLE_ID=MMETSP0101 /ASSEMBLY_ACC=CAM_ASM_000211 /LENGTH=439 /DNA_ID=CAMNT_0001475623 /DNA_START=649 /DNA_END=1965 /DNA_ORIENTATION=+